MAVQDLDISRQTFIVAVQRKGKSIIPRGDFILHEDDTIMLYTKKNKNFEEIETDLYY